MPTTSIPGGYILLARKIVDSELMDWPPHYMKLWVWMLNKALWQDGEKLKRGQLVTSISEMQIAGGYKVGYRRRDLTKDEVRSCYEAFAKATMITTTKTTRGMVITILNYTEYQNPNNYEAHNEAHNEDTAKTTGTPHDSKEREEEKKKDPIPPVGGVPAPQSIRPAVRSPLGFDEFWELYPKKVGKQDSMKVWVGQKINGELPIVLDGVRRYLRSKKVVEGYVMDPAKFLRGRRWEDEHEMSTASREIVKDKARLR